jgi:hypothetical protein
MSAYDNLPRVAHVIDAYTVVLNIGSSAGVELGQKYLIFGLGGEIVDPATQESLGRLELVRGRGRVAHLQEKMSVLKSVETYTTDRGRKLIKRQGGYSLLGMGTEEVIENPTTEEKAFEEAAVGDYAKKI